MRFKFLTYKGLATTSFIISILLFLLSMLEIFSNNNTDDIAAHTSATIEARLEKLDGFKKEVEDIPTGETLQIRDLPADMVIYRYVNDTL